MQRKKLSNEPTSQLSAHLGLYCHGRILRSKNQLNLISKQNIVVLAICLCSCANQQREKLVDKSQLTSDDYRLFQGTPAWGLAKAVQDEDEKQMIEIVKKNSTIVNYQEPQFGNTLLMLTIMNQQMKSFTILLANKANLNIHNSYDGTSALIEACYYDQYDSRYAQMLIESGANINDVEVGERRQGNSTRFTPLMAASREGKLDLVEVLIKKGANINYQNEFKQTALSEAILVDRYNTALYLLQSGADYTQPIFYRPEEKRDIYLVDILREDFFDLDSKEHKYKMQIVDFLRKKGIDYKLTPIPDFIKRKAKEKYPGNWQQYLENY